MRELTKPVTARMAPHPSHFDDSRLAAVTEPRRQDWALREDRNKRASYL